MGMLFRKSEQDPRRQNAAPKQRMLPYKLASYEHDHEGKRLKSSKVVYSFWSASKYVLILSLMLWWLPMFGQMIAGYVGGRRAGGPWKGVAASIIPVVCLYAVITGFDSGVLPSHAFGVAIAPSAIGASLTHSIPFISPYLQFSADYIGSFVKMLEGSSPYGINVYVLTVAFAYIGGVLAEQNRRELEYNSGAVMSTTTVLVHDPNSMYGYPAGGAQDELPARPAGVVARLGGVFHRPVVAQEPQAMTMAYGRRRRYRDPWAYAAEMRYEDDDATVEDDRFMMPSVEPLRPPEDYGAYQYGGQSRRARKKQKWRQQQAQQKRRGRPNMSAKPRFRYQQYSEQAPRQYSNTNGSWRRQRRPQQYYSVSPDPRSIKRARRQIDSEWGKPRHQHAFAELSNEPPVEADTVVHHHRKDHGVSHNWDSI
jgi:hypothetical protein